jgi:hypothetical protein
MADVKTKESGSVPAQRRPAQGPAAYVRSLFVDKRNQLNLKLLNALLLSCCAALAVRFAYIVNGACKKMNAIDFRLTSEPGTDLREKVVLKKLEYYLEKVKKRDIFRMGVAARPENVIEAGPSSKALEATQNLRLVGISWSDDPDAMVEDVKAQKTFFVKKGQAIGEIKVENITKDKLFLRVDREVVELR